MKSLHLNPISHVDDLKPKFFSDSKTFLKGTQSLNPHNDYSQNFVDTGQRPQNFIRDFGMEERFEEYPKLRELIKLKDDQIADVAFDPMYIQADLKVYDLHANVDLDIIITEEPEYASTDKPEEIFHIIEHFCLGTRRLHVFGNDNTIRRGWVTVGPNISTTNFNVEKYLKLCADPEGKFMLGAKPDIELLRPKSPTKKMPSKIKPANPTTVSYPLPHSYAT